MDVDDETHSLSSEEFISILYKLVLGRAPEEGIVEKYKQGFESGRLTRKALLRAMLYSSEGLAWRELQEQRSGSMQISPEWSLLFLSEGFVS